MRYYAYRAIVTGVTVFLATIVVGLAVPRLLFYALERLAEREDGLQ